MELTAAQQLAREAGLALERKGGRLVLLDGAMEVYGDFTRMLPRLKQGVVQREMLVKAARVKGVASPVAVDATAGLGEDALLLAAAGFTVVMFERDPVIAALLDDALTRATQTPALAETAARMSLHAADSIESLPRLDARPDVVVLDPMFPAKHGDARAKKKLQMIQRLESPCADEGALLGAAFDAQPRKIVVKRPLKGPFLDSRKPAYSLKGKTIRYDVYIP
ncbi:MAG: SAM-dependent methyltransferase [Coriobacteriaceae bacterium]|nr:SAM-dependent methyltransferase [Coriobacteriaceae bacterium]